MGTWYLSKCGWIHLTLEHPEIPYEAPEEKEPQYPSITCWFCGQEGHYSKECPIKHEQRERQFKEMYGTRPYEDTTYPLEIGTGPQIVDGYLNRPSSNSITGKTTSYPVKSYTPDKTSKGVPRKERVPEKRGVDKESTPPEQPQGSAGGSGGGAPGGRPPGKGPPGGGDDGDDDEKEGDDKDKKEKDSKDEYKKLNLTPGEVPVMIGDEYILYNLLFQSMD